MRRLFFPLACALLLLAAPFACMASALQAKAIMLVNLGSGKTLYARNADAQIPPASLTKIMTSFLTLDAVKAKKIRLNQKVRISPLAAKTGGSAMRIRPGENMPVVRLLAGMAVSSGNDAATALAEAIGGSVQKFVASMNVKARQLGMKRTLFKNPTGLPAVGHKSTARDLAALCRAYLRAHPQARRFHSMKYFMHQGAVSRNTNPLLGRIAGVDGLKTGWTIASGYNLIITAQRAKTRLLLVLLGCSSKESRDQAAIRLLEAGFKYPANAALVKKALEDRLF